MRHRFANLFRWLVPGFVLQLPGMWLVDARLTHLITIPGEWCVCVALATVFPQKIRGARFLAAAWILLWTLECVRTAGQSLMASDPLLYDLLFLTEHLAILVADLWGMPTLIGGLLGFLLILAGLWFAVARIVRPPLESKPTRRFATIAAGLALIMAPLIGPLGGRWVAHEWVANLIESTQTWHATRQSLSVDPYGPLGKVSASHKPDVGLYVVESYGRVLDTTRTLNRPYHALLDELEPALVDQGFHIASGWATATVSGGRSWISDASVMLGVGIGHQSMWSHVQPHIEGFTHLPAWMRGQGYQTVVCRPKDRARLGLDVRNDFAWDHTVFADDLAYDGVPIGWGQIPDQYSLGMLHTEALPTVAGPRFLFFHGVSSHGPWETVPTLAPDWQGARDQVLHPETEEAKDDKQSIYRQAKRFGHALDNGGIRLPGRVFPQLRKTYFQAIDYSLRATLGSFDALPPSSGGHLLIVYGDHQPPFIARRGDFGVPVHVFATNPDWLEPFLEVGFEPGIHPHSKQSTIPLTGLYPLLARALSGAALSEVPTGIDLHELATFRAPAAE